MIRAARLLMVVVVVWLVQAASTEPVMGDLLAYYPFDTDATDVSGNSHDGTMVGSPTFVTGKLGGAIEFNGTTQYVTVPNTGGEFEPESLTIATWINLDPGGHTLQIIGDTAHGPGAAGWAFQKHGLERAAIASGDGSSFPEIFSADNSLAVREVWHHVAASVVNGGNISLYLDGVLEAQEPYTGTQAARMTNFYIGATDHSDGTGSFNRFFSGRIDDLCIWDEELDEDRIAEMYNNGEGAICGVSVADVDGDTNFDNRVTATDLSRLAANWDGLVGNGKADGDFNEDNRVNQADLDVLTINWHCDATADPLDPSACADLVPSPPASAGALPEPSSLLLAAIGMLGLLASGRRTRRAA